jgi:DNA/RNA endonuclease YhcR with UshA esterase domain
MAIPAKIGATEASKYYEETMIVTGKVAQVTVRPNITFINLDRSDPSSPFNAVIFPEYTSTFGNVQELKGHDVEISGSVTEYRGKPEIILESTNQVKVVDGN